MDPRVRPALAVMAKVPGRSAVKSRLQPALSPALATALYESFLLDRLDAVLALDGIRPVVAFTPEDAESAMATLAPPGFLLLPQRGADLGTRLTTLFAELLGRGHPAAMAMDSDSPSLPMAYVSEAANVLAEQRADVVLGPCEDGGYYLIGLAAPQPVLFEGIAWSTETVFTTTLAKARARNLSVHVLPRWFDVDTERDLRRLCAEMHAGTLGARRTHALLSQIFAGKDQRCR